MYELGKKDQVLGRENLKKFTLNGRPQEFPFLQSQEKVICGYDQGLGERLIVCESLADMQELDDKYAQGYALYIYWYIGNGPGFIWDNL